MNQHDILVDLALSFWGEGWGEGLLRDSWQLKHLVHRLTQMNTDKNKSLVREKRQGREKGKNNNTNGFLPPLLLGEGWGEGAFDLTGMCSLLFVKWLGV